MTAITFLKTPSATPTQTADGPAIWQALADTTDQNFALVNGWLNSGRPWPTVWQSRLSVAFTPATQTNWTEVGSTWQALTIPVIPQGIRGMWIILSGLHLTNNALVNYLAIGAAMSGPGFSNPRTPDETEVSSTGQLIGASRWLSVAASDLVAGQSCTLTPVYRQTGTAAPIQATLNVGELSVVCLV